jgi:hypothetical protein
VTRARARNFSLFGVEGFTASGVFDDIQSGYDTSL